MYLKNKILQIYFLTKFCLSTITHQNERFDQTTNVGNMSIKEDENYFFYHPSTIMYIKKIFKIYRP